MFCFWLDFVCRNGRKERSDMGGEGEEDALAVKYESRELCCSHKQQSFMLANYVSLANLSEYTHSQAYPVFVLRFALV